MKKIVICLVIFYFTIFNIHAKLNIRDTIMLASKNDVYWGSSSELELVGYADYGKYGSTNLSDNDPSTCWAEGAESNGIGEYIWMSIPQNTNQIKIRNGFQKSESLYLANNRPKEIEVELFACYQPAGYVTETHTGFFITHPMAKTNKVLEDKTGYQNIDLEIYWPEISDQLRGNNILEKDRFVLKIKIADIYQGNKWTDACISDIETIPNPVFEVTADEHGFTKNSENHIDTLFYDADNIYQVIDLTHDAKWIIFILMPSDIENSRTETIYKLYNTKKEAFIDTEDITQMYGFVEKDGNLFIEGLDNKLNEVTICLDHKP